MCVVFMQMQYSIQEKYHFGHSGSLLRVLLNGQVWRKCSREVALILFLSDEVHY